MTAISLSPLADAAGIADEGVGAIKYRAAPVANINANARIFLS
jgi:hypothetical protein